MMGAAAAAAFLLCGVESDTLVRPPAVWKLGRAARTFVHWVRLPVDIFFFARWRPRSHLSCGVEMFFSPRCSVLWGVYWALC